MSITRKLLESCGILSSCLVISKIREFLSHSKIKKKTSKRKFLKNSCGLKENQRILIKWKKKFSDYYDIFNIEDFFQILEISLSTDFLIKLNFGLEIDMEYILRT